MRNMLLMAALLLATLSQPAHAFLSTADAIQWLDKGGQQSTAARMYISGMAEAYWAASVAGKEDGKAVICFPKTQNLQTEELQLMAVLSLKKYLNSFGSAPDEIKAKQQFLKNPASMALLIAWIAEYPCN